MKNQYFGDINDYKKYSLIRYISNFGQIKTTICWLLTQDDNGGDGNHTHYLEQPDKWGSYDVTLYKFLQETIIKRRNRDIKSMEESNIIENCNFFSMIIKDDAKSRDLYFNEFLEYAKDSDLVFFDPDNGLEVKSVPLGKKKSSKYLYWHEVKATYEAGHSLLIYQHFPRMQRESYIGNLVNRFREIIGNSRSFYYKTRNVVFFLLAQPKHEQVFIDNNSNILNTWGKHISVCELVLD